MQIHGHSLVVLVILIAICCCIGCTDRSFSSEQNGTTIPVKAGDTVRIQLAENPSTGFSWNATTNGDLIISRTGYETGNLLGEMMGMVGVGGSRTWEITIGNDQVQTFSAKYKRPWEPENRTLRFYEITFTVT